MGKDGLKKKYQDSIKKRLIKQSKWERALEGVIFKEPTEIPRNCFIKQKITKRRKDNE